MLRLKLLRRRGEEVKHKLVPVSKLLPQNAEIIDKNAYGALYVKNGKLGLVNFKVHPVWGELAPLFASQKVEEVWILPNTVIATIQGLGRTAVETRESLEELVVRLVAETGVRVDLRRPYGATELEGWRISVQIEPAGQTEIVAARIKEVPPLTALVDPLLAARLLLLFLRPSTVVIAGPPGSGKTTLLNSVLVEVGRLFPQLHISLVERHKELVVEGGWVTRSVGEIGTLTRFSVRYKRPDVLVVGELAADDIWSFVEVGKSGLPVMATYHSPNVVKAIKTMRDALRLHLGPDITEQAVLGYIDVFVMTEKIVTLQGIERRVSAVYVSDGQRLQPIYVEGRHTPAEMFDKALPERLVVGEAGAAKKRVYEALGVDKLRKYVIEPLEPVLVA